MNASITLPNTRNPVTIAVARYFQAGGQQEAEDEQRRQQPKHVEEVQRQVVQAGEPVDTSSRTGMWLRVISSNAASTANGMLINPAIAPSARYLWSLRSSMVRPTGIR